VIVIFSEEFNSRDIIFHRRNGDVHRISETYHSDDDLQYLILIYRREDGYYFNIKLRNSRIDEDTNKKFSAMNYYSYRLMIRKNAENHTLKSRKLFY